MRLRMLGLLVLVMAALVPAARADAFTCQYAQAGADPGAGESAFFFLSCEGANAPLTFSAKTQPLHGTLGTPSDDGGLWHMTYTAADDLWGVTDSWVMTGTDGTQTADVTVKVKIAAAPSCAEIVDGTRKPVGPWTVERGHRYAVQLFCSYGGRGDVTSVTIKRQAAHGFAWVASTDDGPSAPRLRYAPKRGYLGPDTFVLNVSVGTGSADIPVTMTVKRDRTAPVLTVTAPTARRRAVVFQPACSEPCTVTARVLLGRRVAGRAKVYFSGTHTLRVRLHRKALRGHRHPKLRYVLVARDAAGNLSRPQHGTLRL